MREPPPGLRSDPHALRQSWPHVPAWNLHRGENGCCPMFSEKTVRSPACHGVSSTMAVGHGLSRYFRPSAERNKLQIVPDVRSLTLPQSFQLSLTTGQYFGRSELLKQWSSSAFTPKKIGFFVFCFSFFFFGKVIVVHIYPMARGACYCC